MANSLHWRSTLGISRRAEPDVLMSNIEVDLIGASLYRERIILKQAFEMWLENWDREFGYLDRQASKRRMP